MKKYQEKWENHRLAYTHKLTEIEIKVQLPSVLCVLDKNSEAESHSHTLTYYEFCGLLKEHFTWF